MALTTYAGLIAEIWGDLAKTQVTDLAESWIAAAESRMNAALRVRQMVARSTATISAGFADLPTDFVAPRHVRLVASPYTLLKFLTEEQMAEFKAALPTGALVYYSIVGNELEFAPAPTSNTDVELRYYQKIPALSVSNTSNWALAAYPLAYKTGALVEAAGYYRDADLQDRNEGLFQGHLELIRLNSVQADAFNLTPTPSAVAV